MKETKPKTEDKPKSKKIKYDIYEKFGVSKEIKKTMEEVFIADDSKKEFILRRLYVPRPINQKLLRALREHDLPNTVKLITALGHASFLKLQYIDTIRDKIEAEMKETGTKSTEKSE